MAGVGERRQIRRFSRPSSVADLLLYGEAVSLCEPFCAVMSDKPWQGRSQRIYQDLVAEHGFSTSYSSVRRSLQRLR